MARVLLAMLLVLSIAGIGTAKELKATGDGARSGRQGGEGFGDATVIPNPLPYTDSGATCGNSHDQDLSCGYTAGISPDVFYSYTACQDGMINVSLCGSGYDTQLGIFNSSQVELYCNDDFCGLQSEIDNIPVTAGQLYYIEVSGFYGSCGSYVLNVTGPICHPVPTQQTNWGMIKSIYR